MTADARALVFTLRPSFPCPACGNRQVMAVVMHAYGGAEFGEYVLCSMTEAGDVCCSHLLLSAVQS